MTKKKPPDFYYKRDPITDEEWEEKARYLNVESGAVLKEQTRLADEILEKIFAEEKESSPTQSGK